MLERNISGRDNLAFAVNVVTKMYVSRLQIIGNNNSDALKEVDKALLRESTFSQLLDEIMLNILLPHVHIGAYKRPYKWVRIVPRRATSFISLSGSEQVEGQAFNLPRERAREE